MRIAIVIPARYSSSRFPGKPLAILRGPDGAKTLVQRSWEAAIEAAARCTRDEVRVVVATDDARISTTAQGFGAEVVMTPTTCRNGTERCAAALPQLGEVDLVVNLQGDAPLTPPEFVVACIDAMRTGGADAATPVLRCDAETLAMFRADRAAGRVGGTTAVFGPGGRALYFSKEVLPYVPDGHPADAPVPVFHHVGLYAYTPEALLSYARLDEGALEKLEGLEQLRFLENGLHVRAVEVAAQGRVFWELNNPIDITRIESILA